MKFHNGFATLVPPGIWSYVFCWSEISLQDRRLTLCIVFWCGRGHLHCIIGWSGSGAERSRGARGVGRQQSASFKCGSQADKFLSISLMHFYCFTMFNNFTMFLLLYHVCLTALPCLLNILFIDVMLITLKGSSPLLPPSSLPLEFKSMVIKPAPLPLPLTGVFLWSTASGGPALRHLYILGLPALTIERAPICPSYPVKHSLIVAAFDRVNVLHVFITI